MTARPGTMAAQLEKPDVTLVVPVGGMSDGQMIEHCRARHRDLRYITRNEHEAAHRLREHEDHLHENHVDDPPQPETQTKTKSAEPQRRRSPAR